MGQVGYLIVSIPDLCTLTYYEKSAHTLEGKKANSMLTLIKGTFEYIDNLSFLKL